MAAPEWQVRNAASLAFTSLLVRLLGFRNPSKVRPLPFELPHTTSCHRSLYHHAVLKCLPLRSSTAHPFMAA